jgi:D-alanine-D-alanine ligase
LSRRYSSLESRSEERVRVAVLMGGRSTEREISLLSGCEVLTNLDGTKYDVQPFIVDDHAAFIDSARDGRLIPPKPEALRRAIAEARSRFAPVAEDEIRLPAQRDPRGKRSWMPDVVFIAMHGKFGEDGTVQGLFEILGIPYTGSGVLASALAMDKAMSKRLFSACGIPTPRWSTASAQEIERSAEPVADAITAELGLPMAIKPNAQGSSVGVGFPKTRRELIEALKVAAAHDDLVLAEEFIGGTEISVGVLGNDDCFALPVVEIVPKSGVYDYESKYTPGATEEIVPARIPEAATARAQELACAAHRALGCRGMSRVDMKLHRDSVYVLEVNTIPGMTQLSILPTAAAEAGISFSDLLDRIIASALARRACGEG